MRLPLDYEELYDRHAAATSDAEAVGSVDAGDFDRIGAIELGILVHEGLRPDDALVDLGCGTGRLAQHAVRWLRGRYVGIEISRDILERAERLVRSIDGVRCEVDWIHQADAAFPLAEASVDVICAFSVFTHMEHEDSYRYLADARRVVRPGGTFVYSCLPLESAAAQHVFLASAAQSLSERWSQVRNVTTSRDMMDAIARLAGWEVVHWHAGDQVFPLLDGSAPGALGQAVSVLRRPADT